MDVASITERQNGIIQELGRIRIMKKGSVTFQRFAGGSDEGGARKSYPVFTWKEEGRTKSVRLKTPEEVAWAQDAVENYRRFMALCREYEHLAERLALNQRDQKTAATNEAEKKGLKSRKKPKRK